MDISPQVYVISEWTLMGICFLTVITRITVRLWCKISSFWLSEIFLLLAVLFFLALVIGDTYNISIGFVEFGVYYSKGFAMWMFFSSIVFDLGFYFPRFSMLAFYYELFPITEERLRLCLYLTIGYTACGFFTTAFLDLFWCGVDIPRNWQEDSECTLIIDTTPLFIHWPIGIVSEIFIFCLPFGMLSTLKAMPKGEKVGLICLFLVGGTTILVSIARLVLTTQSIFAYGLYIIAWAENTTQIIVISLPSLRPLLRVALREWDRMQSRILESVKSHRSEKERASHLGDCKSPVIAGCRPIDEGCILDENIRSEQTDLERL